MELTRDWRFSSNDSYLLLTPGPSYLGSIFMTARPENDDQYNLTDLTMLTNTLVSSV